MTEARTRKRDKQRYVKLSFDGSHCICEPHEAEQMMKDDPELVEREIGVPSEALKMVSPARRP